MSPVDHLHLSSYFLAFRRPVIADPGFRRRIDTVGRQLTKPRVILKYELGLSRYLLTHGFQVGAVIDDLYPYLPIYTTDYWELLERGFPLLKRNLLSENPRQDARSRRLEAAGHRRWCRLRPSISSSATSSGSPATTTGAAASRSAAVRRHRRLRTSR